MRLFLVQRYLFFLLSQFSSDWAEIYVIERSYVDTAAHSTEAP
jgi:hypothetical protein